MTMSQGWRASTSSVTLRYRLQQFWRALRAQVEPAERQAALAYLPAAAAELFLEMPVDSQRHSLNVLASLQRAGPHNPDLAAAALLHDVGKVAAGRAGLRLNLWWRGPLVLLELWWPALLRRLALPRAEAGWRYLVHVHLAHPLIGAEWARTAGCSSRTCWLIAHHQDQTPPATDGETLALLRALQWADGNN